MLGFNQYSISKFINGIRWKKSVFNAHSAVAAVLCAVEKIAKAEKILNKDEYLEAMIHKDASVEIRIRKKPTPSPEGVSEDISPVE
tara:strand:- start:220 stop:477 length:258 start_codon:yes stop_codon:yes gene_type:complete